jgi:hypothetical protein
VLTLSFLINSEYGGSFQGYIIDMATEIYIAAAHTLDYTNTMEVAVR